jgi:hypothetical protein
VRGRACRLDAGSIREPAEDKTSAGSTIFRFQNLAD